MKLEPWMLENENWDEDPDSSQFRTIQPIKARIANDQKAKRREKEKELMKKRVRKYRQKRKIE